MHFFCVETQNIVKKLSMFFCDWIEILELDIQYFKSLTSLSLVLWTQSTFVKIKIVDVR